MSPNPFDPLASDYEKHAGVAAEAGKRLLERLDGLRFVPESILDMGCATGQTCRALHLRFGRARIIGLDRSAAMLAKARRGRGFWRPKFELLQADFEDLPLVEASIDMVYANLSLSWSNDPQRTLVGLRRALRPGGLLLLSLFGPDTLGRTGLEPDLTLRLRPHVQQLAAWLIEAGFSEPVLDTDWLTATYSSRASLMTELQGSGLLDAKIAQGRQPANGNPPAPGALAVDWEIVSASAWAPEAGQPVRGAFGDEVSIPVSSIGVRRRS